MNIAEQIEVIGEQVKTYWDSLITEGPSAPNALTIAYGVALDMQRFFNRFPEQDIEWGQGAVPVMKNLVGNLRGKIRAVDGGKENAYRDFVSHTGMMRTVWGMYRGNEQDLEELIPLSRD
jgi:hypothetical protein